MKEAAQVYIAEEKFQTKTSSPKQVPDVLFDTPFSHFTFLAQFFENTVHQDEMRQSFAMHSWELGILECYLDVSPPSATMCKLRGLTVLATRLRVSSSLSGIAFIHLVIQSTNLPATFPSLLPPTTRLNLNTAPRMSRSRRSPVTRNRTGLLLLNTVSVSSVPSLSAMSPARQTVGVLRAAALQEL